MDEFRKFFDKIYHSCGDGEDVLEEDLNKFSEFLKQKIESGISVKLYRYSATNYYNIRSLETDCLKLMPIGNMNDIFEGVQITDDSGYKETDLEIIKDVVTIKSFSEKCNSPYMWGVYADEAKGMCIEYDLSLLPNNHEALNHIFPVLYYQNRFKGGYSIKSIKKVMENYQTGLKSNQEESSVLLEELIETTCELTSLYLVKSNEWENEQEWRIVRNIAEKKSEKKDDFISLPCVTRVIMGYRLNDLTIRKHLEEIVEHKSKIQGRNIELVQAKLHPTEYKVICD